MRPTPIRDAFRRHGGPEGVPPISGLFPCKPAESKEPHYERQPKNIKVQGLRGRWDVCLHAVEKNGTREYWWVLNADGVDGEEGYWTTRKAKGEYKYFCDAGWGDADNAITHLEEELAD